MIEVQSLVKVYPGPVSALVGIDLEIGPGMFGLLGPNGAGKTTLMRILAGLLQPTSGKVRVDGIDVARDPADVWERLGYLPQSFGFYPHLTGEEMLLHLLRLKGVTAPQGQQVLCRELLERVNLGFAAKRKTKTYSGGMRQRLGIAQALSGDPKLIIVDEPTAGLDPEERLRFYRLLAELAENRTVLLSTHIVEDVAVLCPRFAVIRAGRVVALTSPAQARRQLEGKIFEGSATGNELATLQSSHEVTQAHLVEGHNQVRVHVSEGSPPPGFHPSPPTLEDAYLVLMRDGRAPAGTGPVHAAAPPKAAPAAGAEA
ncbi:MAG TPA: ABC transporter ATP-binding protein [Thermoanaerobaculia bacterium]|nr:ABC transporter ATP-binding protein [Thermoanaerobaculia bacterium]